MAVVSCNVSYVPTDYGMIHGIIATGLGAGTQDLARDSALADAVQVVIR